MAEAMKALGKLVETTVKTTNKGVQAVGTGVKAVADITAGVGTAGTSVLNMIENVNKNISSRVENKTTDIKQNIELQNKLFESNDNYTKLMTEKILALKKIESDNAVTKAVKSQSKNDVTQTQSINKNVIKNAELNEKLKTDLYHIAINAFFDYFRNTLLKNNDSEIRKSFLEIIDKNTIKKMKYCYNKDGFIKKGCIKRGYIFFKKDIFTEEQRKEINGIINENISKISATIDKQVDEKFNITRGGSIKKKTRKNKHKKKYNHTKKRTRKYNHTKKRTRKYTVKKTRRITKRKLKE